MSNPPCHDWRMKIEKSSWFQHMTAETFAYFGTARLVRHLAGRFELIGGTPADHAAAREWCCLFAPNVVFPSAMVPVSEDRPRTRESFAPITGDVRILSQT